MEDIFIGYLEDKHYKKIRKSDKPVVFTGRNGAIWGIVMTLLLAALLGWCFTVSFDPEGTWFWCTFGIFCLLMVLWFLFFFYANLNARVILTKESISMIGPVRDFEDEFLADIKVSLRQLFLVNRHVEMKWSEIEKVERRDHRGLGLFFYTKAGQRYFLNTSLLDIKFMPTFKRYMKYKTCIRWWYNSGAK